MGRLLLLVCGGVVALSGCSHARKQLEAQELSPVVRKLEAPSYSGADLFAAVYFGVGPALGAVAEYQAPSINTEMTEAHRSFLVQLEKRYPGFLRNFYAMMTSHNPIQVRVALQQGVRNGRVVYARWKKLSRSLPGSYNLLEAGAFERSSVAQETIVMDLADTLSAT